VKPPVDGMKDVFVRFRWVHRYTMPHRRSGSSSCPCAVALQARQRRVPTAAGVGRPGGQTLHTPVLHITIFAIAFRFRTDAEAGWTRAIFCANKSTAFSSSREMTMNPTR
jgi:hypothetical protein